MSGESGFLAAIQAADWLEEQDRMEWSGYLRTECELASLAPDDPRRDGLLAFLREVATEIDPGWLAMVTRVPVEKCGLEFQFRCPKRWEQLQPTTEESVRFCGECRKDVFFCTSIAAAQSHAYVGDCVAVDPRLVRKPNDLESEWEGELLTMGIIMPYEEEAVPKDEEPDRPRWWQRFARTMRDG
jgi:hypothetical protein